MESTSSSLLLGFDVGSVATKAVIMHTDGSLVCHRYLRTQGQPIEKTLELLQELCHEVHTDRFAWVAGTGNTGRFLCQLLDVPFINEVIAQASAVRSLHPQARTILEMGGQDCKLIRLPADSASGQLMDEFAMNTNCAAGTGSFLDQQASRLGVRIEDEFGELALESQTPPRVAGRCSVFAKSDMIHLQQKATPVYDIIAGLCMGLARNLKSDLARGMELQRPVVFCGGVASNAGVIRAIREVFGFVDGELIVPELHAVSGALGALMAVKTTHAQGNQKLNLNAIREHLAQQRTIGTRLAKLTAPAPVEHHNGQAIRRTDTPIDAYLGVDVGSISTKAAVTDAAGHVLAKIYLRTAGRPLEAVRQVLASIGQQLQGANVVIRGAATTGSGRYLVGDFIGADTVVNEITAQATAATLLYPDVDTIFEIGGQDSKYISIDNGVVVDFEMNHACAAGTGSFIEEQAERLGVDVKSEFSQLALSSDAPLQLGERCTVFMESDLLNYQQQGARTQDLVAGLCYSIVNNYINRVVGHRRIGKHILFQGGTAFNQGVVAAFEKITGTRITVPEHHEVTGAIGAAAIARQHQLRVGATTSRFGGFNLAEVSYKVRSFECHACSNNCEINEVRLPGRDALFYGSRCDRFNAKATQTDNHLPDLFAEREQLLLRHAGLEQMSTERPSGKKTVGIPLAMAMRQMLPFWATLMRELGLHVVISGDSTKQLIRRGVEAVASNPCFPVKVAHGHIAQLLDQEIDYILIPSIVALPAEPSGGEYNQLCPYVTGLPYQAMAAFDSLASGKRPVLLRPSIRLDCDSTRVAKWLNPLADQIGASTAVLRKAVNAALAAQDAFDSALRERGKQILDTLPADQRAVIIVGRPYNSCDIGVCLDVPAKLRKLGVLPIPMDFLDLPNEKTPKDRVLINMYWKYGQRILKAAHRIRRDPRLHAVYVSNFSCGPDSFLISFFKRIMAPKPSLVLEIDEHSADAGMVTRLEAFLESLHSEPEHSLTQPPILCPPAAKPLVGRTVYVPWMGDYSYAMASALQACGHSAQVMPVSDAASLQLGRRACTGKECLPCMITAGDMLKLSHQKGFDGSKAAFFMPGGSGPCRFGQYNCMHEIIMQERGLPDVAFLSLTQDKEQYEQASSLDPSLAKRTWIGFCAIEMLTRARYATRPYEVHEGQTDAVYEDFLQQAMRLLASGGMTREMAGLMKQAAQAFREIPTAHRGSRPKIGIVGEVFVRLHRGANNDLVRQLERLGAEITVPGVLEWLYYCNWTRCQESKWQRDWKAWMVNLITDKVQGSIERKLHQPFAWLIGKQRDSEVRHTLELATPYIDPTFSGEAILSVGKMIELHHQGCRGLINVMPFTCMPSTVVRAVMKRLSTDLGGVPTLSISYDGQHDPTLLTRLEAFMHQTRSLCTTHPSVLASPSSPDLESQMLDLKSPTLSDADVRSTATRTDA